MEMVNSLLILQVLWLAIGLLSARRAGSALILAASQRFDYALAAALPTRLECFSELKTGAAVFQPLLQGYLLSPARSLLSHIGSLPATLQSESEYLYGN